MKKKLSVLFVLAVVGALLAAFGPGAYKKAVNYNHYLKAYNIRLTSGDKAFYTLTYQTPGGPEEVHMYSFMNPQRVCPAAFEAETAPILGGEFRSGKDWKWEVQGECLQMVLVE